MSAEKGFAGSVQVPFSISSLVKRRARMQLKTKLFMPLVVILLMGMTTSAFAQLSCGVASTPVSRATATGHTEPAGDLIFNCVAGPNPTTASRFTIDYGVPITNNQTEPTGGGIDIENESGSFAAVGQGPTVETVNNEGGQLVILVPAQAAPANGSFTVANVLVSLFGSAGTTLDANVSVSPGNNVFITAGQNVARVISSIRPGIATVELDEGPARFLATGNAIEAGVTDFFTLEVTENYIDMFRSQAQAPTGATNSVWLMIEFDGIPEDGAFNCTADLEGTPAVVTTDPDDGFGPDADIDDGDNVLFVAVAADADLGAIETMTIACDGFDFSDSPTPLLGEITAAVTLAPTGDALDDGDVFDDADDEGRVPRYEEEFFDAVTVATFTPATTTFLVPLVMGNPAVPQPFGSYDTGIAIANTTLDPWETGDDPDEGGALEQDGTLTFYFFPTTGDPFTVTPAQIAGACGANGGGVLARGRTFVCNTSEILREGGRTAAFTGYMFIVAGFTQGHGTAFIYGGTPQERFTSATDVLVIRPPAVFQRLDNPEPTAH
jgi:hypothetical protein